MANLLFATAYREGVTPKNWDYALRLIELSNEFQSDISDNTRGQVDFWHGYVLYQQSLELEKPQTLQSAQLTLPRFQQAARLFALPLVNQYAQGNSISIQQFRDATQQYIEIQEAIIQRGR